MKIKSVFLKICTFVLCVVSCLATACKDVPEEWTEGVKNTNTDSLYQEPAINREKTDYKLVNRGVSEYKIVIPDEATTLEQMAASEISFFLKEAAGATLTVVTSSQVKQNVPTISIGQTSVSQRLKVSVPDSVDLATSGYLIKTVEDTVVILSNPNGDGEGCLYGAYDFLGDAIGYEAFAEDELYYEEKSTVELYKYDEIVQPTFDQRSIGYRSTATDMTYQRRMRLIYQQTDNRWGVHGHNQAGSNTWSILPYNYYSVGHDTCSVGDEARCSQGHPEWYTGSGTQLCYTAGEEMETEFAFKLYKQILKHPNGEYFHFGQEDNNNFCNCSNCTQAMQEWGMNVQGLQIAFANGVVEKTEALLAADEDNKNREIKYMIYAYAGTITAPTVKQTNGTFVAYSDKVIPHEKLYIWFTPINTDFTQALTHTNNLAIYESLQGFNVLCAGRILVYIYDINFYNYLVNFNNFGTVKGMYQEYKDNGVYYMYTQGPVDAVVPTFQEMRIYVESQLMWDISQDYDTLVRKFMTHYFRDGANAMYQYYTLIRNRYAYYQGVVEPNLGSIYSDIGNSSIWTEPVVSEMGACIDEALKAIESLKATDTELYEKVKNRIMKENISVLFLKLSHHSSYYSDEEVAQMKADLKYYTNLFGVNATREGGSLDGLFD